MIPSMKTAIAPVYLAPLTHCARGVWCLVLAVCVFFSASGLLLRGLSQASALRLVPAPAMQHHVHNTHHGEASTQAGQPCCELTQTSSASSQSPTCGGEQSVLGHCSACVCALLAWPTWLLLSTHCRRAHFARLRMVWRSIWLPHPTPPPRLA